MTAIPNIRLMPKGKKYFLALLTIGVILLFVASFWFLRLEFFGGLKGIARTFEFIGRMIAMDFSDWQAVGISVIESLSVAILATILSAALAFFLSFIAASNMSYRPVCLAIKGIVAVIRAIPTIIWTLIFVAYLGFGPFPGVLGLFFHSLAYLVKAFSEAIEGVKGEKIEALRATGASWFHVAARAVYPSIKTSLISWIALRFEINIGQSTILGFVGAGGVGYELSKNIRIYNFHRAGLVVLVLFLMSFGVEMLFHRLKLGIDNRLIED